MPTWRCPHCGVPQPEASRCWVCHRSTTGCGTCRNFRQSVSPGLGYCGLDRTRRALSGDEIRPCWEARAGASNDQPSLIQLDRARDPTWSGGASLWGDAEG